MRVIDVFQGYDAVRAHYFEGRRRRGNKFIATTYHDNNTSQKYIIYTYILYIHVYFKMKWGSAETAIREM